MGVSLPPSLVSQSVHHSQAKRDIYCISTSKMLNYMPPSFHCVSYSSALLCQFAALNFCFLSASLAFTKVLASVLAHLHSRGIPIVEYVDNLLLR